MHWRASSSSTTSFVPILSGDEAGCASVIRRRLVRVCTAREQQLHHGLVPILSGDVAGYLLATFCSGLPRASSIELACGVVSFGWRRSRVCIRHPSSFLFGYVLFFAREQQLHHARVALLSGDEVHRIRYPSSPCSGLHRARAAAPPRPRGPPERR